MSRIILTITASLALLFSGTASANECLSAFPNGTVPHGNIKVCQSGFTGLHSQYSCQDYQHGNNRYRVIYKGGLEPKAIVKIKADKSEQLIWSPSFGDNKMRCPLPAPMSVPKHAIHRGLGICQDDNNTNIPCSVYEHAQARQNQAYRYLVFYMQGDAGPEVAHQMAVGNNQDAMVAEIAYQLGISLLDTSCCSEQASAYLEHAHRLFPKANAYRAGYLDALEQLAVNAGEGSDL